MSVQSALPMAMAIYSLVSPLFSGLSRASNDSPLQVPVEIRVAQGIPVEVRSAAVEERDSKSVIKFHVTNVSDKPVTNVSVWIVLYAKSDASIWSNDIGQDQLQPGADFESSWQNDKVPSADRIIMFVSKAENKEALWILDPDFVNLLEKANHDYVSGNSYVAPDLNYQMTPKPLVVQLLGEPSSPAPAPEIAAPNTVDLLPQLLKKPTTIYTEEARKRGIQGVVRARILVGTDGMTKKVTILRGLPYGLNEEAISAAYQMRFRPAMKDGKPVPYSINVDIEFSLGLGK